MYVKIVNKDTLVKKIGILIMRTNVKINNLEDLPEHNNAIITCTTR